MSLPSRDNEESHRRFLKFKEDIEARLKQWLQDHPETPAPAKRARPEPKLLPTWTDSFRDLRSIGPDREAARKIEVLPSNYLDGGWVVWADGLIVQSYFGRDAHDKASKLAVRLANNEVSPDDPELQY